MYRGICPPDLVISLSVAVEEAVRRDRIRQKVGPKEASYVRFRHGMANQPKFKNSQSINLNTDKPLAETIVEVKKKLWKYL